jgi:toxin-antitoxin system PIN domain toxin
MTTFLLDANALIALTVAEHEHHERVAAWAAAEKRFALCPITEGALIRYCLRVGESTATARAVLAAIREMPSVEFWPDALSYDSVDLDHVRGHRQVTDAYLAALARARAGSKLATLDQGLALAAPDVALLIA